MVYPLAHSVPGRPPDALNTSDFPEVSECTARTVSATRRVWLLARADVPVRLADLSVLPGQSPVPCTLIFWRGCADALPFVREFGRKTNLQNR